MKYLNEDVLGGIIFKTRKKKKINQTDLAKMIGMSKETFIKREKDPGDITMKEFRRIALVLEEDPAELIKLATKEF